MSQDKSLLMIVKNLYVSGIGKITTDSEEGDAVYTLGKYSTKERAIEVLDEIQQFIISGTTEAHEGDTGTWRKVEKYGTVFEMPAE